MIYVDRNNVPVPEIFESETLHQKKAQLVEHFTYTGRKVNKQNRVNFDFFNSLDDSFISALNKLFNGKCAICESLVPSKNINRFRPSQNAMNLDGKVSRNHYWWMAYEWSNFYSFCFDCTRARKNRFPVKGHRTKEGEDVSKENILLLDPCNANDFIRQPIQFLKDGTAVGINEKAEITIDVFQLNRKQLLYQRRRKMDDLYRHLELMNSTDDSSVLKDSSQNLKNMMAPDEPYLAAAKSVMQDFEKELKSLEIKSKASELIQAKNQEIRDRLQNYVPEEEFQAFQSIPESKFAKPKSEILYKNLDFESFEQKKSYFTTEKRITKIEINNFKIIESLIIDFPKVKELDQEPWLVLLGENGSGKSTVLQALALTLMGSEHANSLGLDASKFVNRNTKGSYGSVRVHLTGLEEPMELKFSNKSSHFDSNYTEPIVLLQAFGSTRLMSPKLQDDVKMNLIHVENLFNPYVALLNIENWLGDSSKVKTSRFNEICTELKKLLLLPEERTIRRRRLKDGNFGLFFKLSADRKEESLLELSAGYQAVIILSLTIMRKMLEVWDHFKLAEGIVLIDELGVHLHPRWKLQIVENLRTIFPNLTFVITTHEPLCLRGIKQGEVLKMISDDQNNVVALPISIAPDSLSVDEMITSGLFGLLTSLAPDVEMKMNTYFFLKAKPKRSKKENAQFTHLERELTKLGVIGGHTLLDKTEEIVHETFVKEVYVKKHDSSKVDAEVKKRLSKLFARK